MAAYQVSVRGLVEFTCHGEDILPGGSLKDMQDGMTGHLARQEEMDNDWLREAPLKLSLNTSPGETLLLAGRMDGFRPGPLGAHWRARMDAEVSLPIKTDQSHTPVDLLPASFSDVAADIPLVEEIKLWKGKTPPESPNIAHWLQGAVYAAILALGMGEPQIGVQVVYVTKSGKPMASFGQLYHAEALSHLLQALVIPYLSRQRMLATHREARNLGIRQMSFPFASYRAGQREMAVQVYRAIQLKKRLFACMPTGTGKSMAVLFPALKAMGEGLTGQIYYVTARTTGQTAPIQALSHVKRDTFPLWWLVLQAREKCCPEGMVCHPDFCTRSKGHFLRDQAAIQEAIQLEAGEWTPGFIRALSDAYHLCPFELCLSLAEVADVTIGDYNYALDPVVHIKRIFDEGRDVTLLVDEAHHLQSRVRDMLSGTMDFGLLSRFRREVGKLLGRRHGLYRQIGEVLAVWKGVERPPDVPEGVLQRIPGKLAQSLGDLADTMMDVRQQHLPWGAAGAAFQEMTFSTLSMVRALRRENVPHAYLWQGRKLGRLTCFALDGADYLQEITQALSGVVCFSATLEPLDTMRSLLGGDETDGCFAMPSPFPPENLLVIRRPVNTRFARREASKHQVADDIRALVAARAGKYLVFFPSFAYMRQVSALLDDLPHQLQTAAMTEEERSAFLAPYTPAGDPVLSLCVMGGLFSEGIDLPGAALDGVVIVGVGLPQVGLFQETLRKYYEEKTGQGFRYAYQIPGMQKVAQAVGRVIRTPTDRGVALLLDDRFAHADYRPLCPSHWQVVDGNLVERMAAFWRDDPPEMTEL